MMRLGFFCLFVSIFLTSLEAQGTTRQQDPTSDEAYKVMKSFLKRVLERNLGIVRPQLSYGKPIISGKPFPRGKDAITDHIFQQLCTRVNDELEKACIRDIFPEEDAELLMHVIRINPNERKGDPKYQLAKERFQKHFIWLFVFDWPTMSVSDYDRHYLEMEKAEVCPALRLRFLWTFHRNHPGTFSGKKWTNRFETDFLDAMKTNLSVDLLRTLLHYTEEVGYMSEENKRVATFMEKTQETEGLDPYVKDLFWGILNISRAWDARGGGYANTVSEKGWEGFKNHMEMAKVSLEKAWTSRPNIVHAPYRMMKVSLGYGGGQEMRKWFDRTIRARLEYDSAYSTMYWGLMPRWYGSHQAMMSFARECAEQSMYDTKVPVENYLLAHWTMKRDFKTVREIFELPGVYEDTKQHLLMALGHRESWYHPDNLRFDLLAMAYSTRRIEDFLQFLPMLPNQDFPADKAKHFGDEVGVFLDQLNELRRNGASLEDLRERASMWFKSKQDPGFVFRKMENDELEVPLQLEFLERYEFSSDQKSNETFIQFLKHDDRVELGLMRLKHFRDSGASAEEVATLAKSLEQLATPFDIHCLLMLPSGYEADAETCQNLKDSMEEVAYRYGATREELLLAQFRLATLIRYRKWGDHQKLWGKTVKSIRAYGALLDIVSTWGISPLTRNDYSMDDLVWWQVFRIKKFNPEVVDEFFSSWSPAQEEAREKLMTFLRKEGLPSIILETARRLKGTPHEDLGVKWALRQERWWDRRVNNAKKMKVRVIMSYRAMENFIRVDGYQSIARKYALIHAPITKSNSGKWQSAYLHFQAGDLSRAVDTLIEGKYTPYKDSGTFYIPGYAFESPKALLEHLVPMFSKCQGLATDDRNRLKEEFPEFF